MNLKANEIKYFEDSIFMLNYLIFLPRIKYLNCLKLEL